MNSSDTVGTTLAHQDPRLRAPQRARAKPKEGICEASASSEHQKGRQKTRDRSHPAPQERGVTQTLVACCNAVSRVRRAERGIIGQRGTSAERKIALHPSRLERQVSSSAEWGVCKHVCR
jgi:hypothetical protein